MSGSIAHSIHILNGLFIQDEPKRGYSGNLYFYGTGNPKITRQGENRRDIPSPQDRLSHRLVDPDCTIRYVDLGAALEAISTYLEQSPYTTDKVFRTCNNNITTIIEAVIKKVI